MHASERLGSSLAGCVFASECEHKSIGRQRDAEGVPPPQPFGVESVELMRGIVSVQQDLHSKPHRVLHAQPDCMIASRLGSATSTTSSGARQMWDSSRWSAVFGA